MGASVEQAIKAMMKHKGLDRSGAIAELEIYKIKGHPALRDIEDFDNEIEAAKTKSDMFGEFVRGAQQEALRAPLFIESFTNPEAQRSREQWTEEEEASTNPWARLLGGFVGGAPLGELTSMGVAATGIATKIAPYLARVNKKTIAAIRKGTAKLEDLGLGLPDPTSEAYPQAAQAFKDLGGAAAKRAPLFDLENGVLGSLARADKLEPIIEGSLGFGAYAAAVGDNPLPMMVFGGGLHALGLGIQTLRGTGKPALEGALDFLARSQKKAKEQIVAELKYSGRLLSELEKRNAPKDIYDATWSELQDYLGAEGNKFGPVELRPQDEVPDWSMGGEEAVRPATVPSPEGESFGDVFGEAFGVPRKPAPVDDTIAPQVIPSFLSRGADKSLTVEGFVMPGRTYMGEEILEPLHPDALGGTRTARTFKNPFLVGYTNPSELGSLTPDEFALKKVLQTHWNRLQINLQSADEVMRYLLKSSLRGTPEYDLLVRRFLLEKAEGAAYDGVVVTGPELGSRYALALDKLPAGKVKGLAALKKFEDKVLSKAAMDAVTSKVVREQQLGLGASMAGFGRSLGRGLGYPHTLGVAGAVGLGVLGSAEPSEASWSQSLVEKILPNVGSKIFKSFFELPGSEPLTKSAITKLAQVFHINQAPFMHHTDPHSFLLDAVYDEVFEDGLARLGINFQELMPIPKQDYFTYPKKMMHLFDAVKDWREEFGVEDKILLAKKGRKVPAVEFVPDTDELIINFDAFQTEDDLKKAFHSDSAYGMKSQGESVSSIATNVPTTFDDSWAANRDAENNLHLLPRIKAALQSSRFMDWFRDSQLVDKHNSPRVLYHGTPARFTHFGRTVDLGYHVGTLEQATYIRISAQGKNLVPVFVRLENPVRTPDLGNWGPNQILSALRSNADGSYARHFKEDFGEEIPKGLDEVVQRIESRFNAIEKERGSYERRSKKQYHAIKEELKRGGFDGIKYSNTVEGPGDSYLLLDSNQIKSVFNKNYGPTGAISKVLPWAIGAGALLGENDEEQSGEKTLFQSVMDLIGPSAAGAIPTGPIESAAKQAARAVLQATQRGGARAGAEVVEHVRLKAAKTVPKSVPGVFSLDVNPQALASDPDFVPFVGGIENGLKQWAYARPVSDASDNTAYQSFIGYVFAAKDHVIGNLAVQYEKAATGVLKEFGIDRARYKDFYRARTALTRDGDGKLIYDERVKVSKSAREAAIRYREEVLDPVWEETSGIDRRAPSIVKAQGLKEHSTTWRRLKEMEEIKARGEWDTLPKPVWYDKLSALNQVRYGITSERVKGMLHFDETHDLMLKYADGLFSSHFIKSERAKLIDDLVSFKQQLKQTTNQTQANQLQNVISTLEMQARKLEELEKGGVGRLSAKQKKAFEGNKPFKLGTTTALPGQHRTGFTEALDLAEIDFDRLDLDNIPLIETHYIRSLMAKRYLDQVLHGARTLTNHLNAEGNINLSDFVQNFVNYQRGVRGMQENQHLVPLVRAIKRGSRKIRSLYNTELKGVPIPEVSVQDVAHWTDNIMKMQTITKLFLSPRFPIVNSTQTVLTVAPHVRKFKSYLEGFKTALSMDDDAMKLLVRSNTANELEQHMTEVEGVGAKISSKVGRALAFIPKKTEDFNRRVAFFSGYYDALEPGFKPHPSIKKTFINSEDIEERAINYGRAMVDATQFRMGSEGKSQIFVGGAHRRLIGQFKTFNANYFTLFKDAWRYREWGTLSAMLAGLGTLGGAQAVAGAFGGGSLYNYVRGEAIKEFGVVLPKDTPLAWAAEKFGLSGVIPPLDITQSLIPFNLPTSAEEVLQFFGGPTYGGAAVVGSKMATTGIGSPDTAKAALRATIPGGLALGQGMMEAWQGGTFTPTGERTSNRSYYAMVSRALNMDISVAQKRWLYSQDILKALEGGQQGAVQEVLADAREEGILFGKRAMASLKATATAKRKDRMKGVFE